MSGKVLKNKTRDLSKSTLKISIEKNEAEILIKEYLQTRNDKYDLKVIPSKTKEYPFGFVFFVEINKANLKTGDLVPGQGPLILLKSTKEIIEVGSRPLKVVIDEIEKN